VRTQVDRDLTTVSWVDRLLGLIKNLGRHRKKRREIIHEKDRSTRRKQPQVEEDVEALSRHPRLRRKTLSEASP
jgi:carbonic anhydrase